MPVRSWHGLSGARKLAHGGACAGPRRSAADAAPAPGPAREPLPAGGGCSVSFHRRRCMAPAALAWCSRGWAPTVSQLPALFARREARCSPRTRQPARYGECRARWSRPALPQRVLPLSAIAPEILRLTPTAAAAPASSGNRRSSHERLSPMQTMPICASSSFGHLAKRARSLARLSVPNPAHQVAAQPGHDASARSRPSPDAASATRRSSAPSPRQ